MKLIQILGTGCPKCKKLEENTRLAVSQLGLDCEVSKVTDIQCIMRMGVMMTPALVVDGVVRSSGRIPTLDELAAMLQ
jgi:small redox-active disulfide protein 2